MKEHIFENMSLRFLAKQGASFKLLGIHLDDTLTWSTHVNAVTSKATKRLYFLKQLTRAGVLVENYFIFTPQLSVLSLSTRPPSGIMPSPKHKHSNLSQSRSGQSIYFGTLPKAFHIITLCLQSICHPYRQDGKNCLTHSFVKSAIQILA